ncbi:hypothetical protein CBL_06659 [Carabus blaptoides fortunei]
MRVPTERRDLPFEILERGNDHLGHNVNDDIETNVGRHPASTYIILFDFRRGPDRTGKHAANSQWRYVKPGSPNIHVSDFCSDNVSEAPCLVDELNLSQWRVEQRVTSDENDCIDLPTNCQPTV